LFLARLRIATSPSELWHCPGIAKNGVTGSTTFFMMTFATEDHQPLYGKPPGRDQGERTAASVSRLEFDLDTRWNDKAGKVR
jgi:hypothetical protein